MAIKISNRDFESLTEESRNALKDSGVEINMSHSASSNAVANANARRGYDFAIVLYPDDPAEMAVLEYIKNHEHVTKYAYILHDMDIYEEDGTHKERNESGEIVEVSHKAGDPKKAHYHVALHFKTRSTASGVAKFYSVPHSKKIDSMEGTLLYMLHDTPTSQHKHRYSIDELHGSQSLIDLVVAQNSHYLQLVESAQLAKDGTTVADMILDVAMSNKSAKDKKHTIEWIASHGTFLVAMTNQEFVRRRERQRSCELVRAVKDEAEKIRSEASVREYLNIVTRHGEQRNKVLVFEPLTGEQMEVLA